MKKLLAVLLLALMGTGCLSINDRLMPAGHYRKMEPTIYRGVQMDSYLVATPFRVTFGRGITYEYFRSMTTIALPVTLVDWPLEFVVDTVCLPWDLYFVHKAKKTEVSK